MCNHFQGTLPFMSVDLHEDPTAKHLPIYDLQSFFFVFIWICILYTGPGMTTPRLHPELEPWTKRDHKALQAFKGNQTSQQHTFRRQLGSAFTKYFADLVDFAEGFRKAVQYSKYEPDQVRETCPDGNWSRNTAVHDIVIGLFEEEIRRQEEKNRLHPQKEARRSSRIRQRTGVGT
jgi:hypothetical protein